MRFNKLIPAFFAATLLFTLPAVAESKTPPAKTYDEPTFIKLLGNKSKQQVAEMLGQPARKQLAVKPTDAERVLGRPLTPSKGGKDVEMWYYSNIVRYDSKHTYKTTELTFVNGLCTNVAFFNTK